MTGNGGQERNESRESRQKWVSEVQEALDRTGDAVRTAWEATRESRLNALESAKQAAKELGEVIDAGMTAAKERWSAGDEAAEAKQEVVEDIVEPATVEDRLDSERGEGAPPT